LGALALRLYFFAQGHELTGDEIMKLMKAQLTEDEITALKNANAFPPPSSSSPPRQANDTPEPHPTRSCIEAGCEVLCFVHDHGQGSWRPGWLIGYKHVIKNTAEDVAVLASAQRAGDTARKAQLRAQHDGVNGVSFQHREAEMYELSPKSMARCGVAEVRLSLVLGTRLPLETAFGMPHAPRSHLANAWILARTLSRASGAESSGRITNQKKSEKNTAG
jgi:hypothetical protein